METLSIVDDFEEVIDDVVEMGDSSAEPEILQAVPSQKTQEARLSLAPPQQSEASRKRIRAIQHARDIRRRLVSQPGAKRQRMPEPFDFASRVFSCLRRLDQGQLDADLQFSHEELMRAISVQMLPRASGRPRADLFLAQVHESSPFLTRYDRYLPNQLASTPGATPTPLPPYICRNEVAISPRMVLNHQIVQRGEEQGVCCFFLSFFLSSLSFFSLFFFQGHLAIDTWFFDHKKATCVECCGVLLAAASDGACGQQAAVVILLAWHRRQQLPDAPAPHHRGDVPAFRDRLRLCDHQRVHPLPDGAPRVGGMRLRHLHPVLPDPGVSRERHHAAHLLFQPRHASLPDLLFQASQVDQRLLLQVFA